MTTEHSKHPKTLYQQAEASRKSEQTAEARQYYQQAINLSHQRTQARGEAMAQRLQHAQKTLRGRFSLFFLIPLFLAGIAFAVFRAIEHDFADKQAETDPKSFQFVEWLAARQTQQVLSNIIAANPQLSFDFSRSTSNAKLTPEEALQSLMRPEMQDRIRSAGQNGDGGQDDTQQAAGENSFQCSVDQAFVCAAEDQPTASGPQRPDIAMLVRSYRAVLDNEKDCAKIESAITAIGKKIQWRRSEAEVKFDLEQLALNCYSRQKNYEKTIAQARKLQCSSDAASMNTSYWHLTATYHQQGKLADAQRMYTCFRETVQHLATYQFEPWRIAARHRESGALAWLYFNDLDTAVDELESARRILKTARDDSPTLNSVSAEVDLDLMETYVTANIDPETFRELHDDINTSGLLTDGYKQIKDTLAGIYYLQNNEKQKAAIALSNVATRFKHLPEYICSWDWSGFQRGLQQSIPNAEARKRAEQLVTATDCYVPQSIETRIQTINEVLQWLKR